ncbi:MAG: PTS transporter subunit EIIA [Verrucomicrobiaceae bacterium]|jgi:mannitol/fructose-specific phosphotransferase system IIA component (Ntr-type)|nr:PTS transporter subunit EIIA [Verrucomicrobiaceae bacterium]
MKLSSLLSPKQVILDLKGESCAHALAHMVDHLVSRGILDSSLRDEVLSLLEQREAQVSTGIGSGVAIPHAFSDSIDHVIAAFGRSSEGVDFEAIDNAPVNLVMLLIVPEAQHNMHLQTLAAIAKMFHNCSIRQQLHDAETVEDVLAIFDSDSSSVRAGGEN